MVLDELLHELFADVEVVVLKVGRLRFGGDAGVRAEDELLVQFVLAGGGDQVGEWAVKLRCPGGRGVASVRRLPRWSAPSIWS